MVNLDSTGAAVAAAPGLGQPAPGTEALLAIDGLAMALPGRVMATDEERVRLRFEGLTTAAQAALDAMVNRLATAQDHDQAA